MATMIPADVGCFTTEGERQFYKFLESVAKPDPQNIVWYSPDIKGREPDFVLYSYQVGLIIFEVKDWALSQIREANPKSFILSIGSGIETRKNPYKQARDYFHRFRDKIRKDGKLLSGKPEFYGKPVVPMDFGVVFTNIHRSEYSLKGLHQIIETKKIFFSDDLHPTSPICSDLTGDCFADALEDMFPPKFSFGLTEVDLDHLKQLIFPTVRIAIPDRDAKFPYEKRISRLRSLDNNQESLARNFDEGHRIIVGPSGSGKTLILVHKAAFFLRYNPDIKNILFVCFNITLVKYIKRLLADKGVPLRENGVSVLHFYQLCSKILGEEIAYEKEKSEYYEMINQEVIEKVGEYDVRYDAILVDEGQDFSDDMYKIVTALLNRETNKLTIVLDDNQDIYRRESSWKDVGIQARGRVHKISWIYRNTKEISEFASKFIKEEASITEDKKEGQLELFPDFFDFSGPKPIMKQFKNYDDIISYISRKIPDIVTTDECPFSEIAIIYTMKTPYKNLEEPLPIMINKALEANGILSNWTSEDYRSKTSYDITTNSVTISTIHSVKGLDYSCVFLLGLDSLKPKGWTEDQINNLVYVAITRARYQLFIPYIHESSLIKRLKSCV